MAKQATIALTNCVFFKNVGGVEGALSLTTMNSIMMKNVTFIENISLRGLGGGLGLSSVNSGFPGGHATQFTNHDGIFVNTSATQRATGIMLFEDITFVDNSCVTGKGGALVMVEANGLVFNNVKFNGNSARQAGAVALMGSSSATFTHARFNDNQASMMSGGAISVEELSSITLTTAEFNDNAARGYGGAVYVTDLSHMNCQDCHFNTNEANIVGGAISAISGKVTLEDCGVEGNVCEYTESAMINKELLAKVSPGSGGGLYFNWDGKGELKNTKIKNNIASNQGGGFFAGQDCELKLKDTVVLNNKGGGGYLLGAYMEASSSDFNNNNGSASGGITLRQSQAVMEKCNLHDNDFSGATSSGGGVSVVYRSSLTATGCSFKRNTASGEGGAVSVDSTSGLQMEDCVVEDNLALLDGGGVHVGKGVASKIDSVATEYGLVEDFEKYDATTQVKSRMVDISTDTSNQAGRSVGLPNSLSVKAIDRDKASKKYQLVISRGLSNFKIADLVLQGEDGPHDLKTATVLVEGYEAPELTDDNLTTVFTGHQKTRVSVSFPAPVVVVGVAYYPAAYDKGGADGALICMWQSHKGLVTGDEGVDLGGMENGYTRATCEEWCDETEGCNSASFQASSGACWLKDREVNVSDDCDEDSSFVSLYRACAQPSDCIWNTLSGLATESENEKTLAEASNGYTLGTCRVWCDTTPGCRSASFHRESGSCALKDRLIHGSDALKEEAGGFRTLFKDCKQCPAPRTYKFEGDSDAIADDTEVRGMCRWIQLFEYHYCVTDDAKYLGELSLADCQLAVELDPECTSSTKLMYSNGLSCTCLFGEICAEEHSASLQSVYTCTDGTEDVCYDTAGWNNGSGKYCQDYVAEGWCANGSITANSDYAGGGANNSPEDNCCACGKPAKGEEGGLEIQYYQSGDKMFFLAGDFGVPCPPDTFITNVEDCNKAATVIPEGLNLAASIDDPPANDWMEGCYLNPSALWFNDHEVTGRNIDQTMLNLCVKSAAELFRVGSWDYFLAGEPGIVCPENTFITSADACTEAASVIPAGGGQTASVDDPPANDWMQGCYLNPGTLWFNDHEVSSDNVHETMVNLCAQPAPAEAAYELFRVGSWDYFLAGEPGVVCPENSFITSADSCTEAASVIPAGGGQTASIDDPPADDWMSGCYLNPSTLWFNDHAVSLENIHETMINLCAQPAPVTLYKAGQNNYFEAGAPGTPCPPSTLIKSAAFCTEAASVIPSGGGQTASIDDPPADDWMSGCYLNPSSLWFNDHAVSPENVDPTMINLCSIPVTYNLEGVDYYVAGLPGVPCPAGDFIREAEACSNAASVIPEGAGLTIAIDNPPANDWMSGCYLNPTALWFNDHEVDETNIHDTMINFCGRYDGYEHHHKGCVTGHDLELSRGKALVECIALCDANEACMAFEYGVTHGGDTTNYSPMDCNLQDAIDTTDCDGGLYNVDLYIKPEPAPKCEDTPDWINASGYTCEDYNDGWCVDGAVAEVAMGGVGNGSPEQNCCVCGKNDGLQQIGGTYYKLEVSCQSGDLIQIAEVAFYSGDDQIAPEIEHVKCPTCDSPENENISFLVDGDSGTKFLHVGASETIFVWFPEEGVVIDGLTYTTANDAPERDPKTITLSTSDDNISWTVLLSLDNLPSNFARLTTSTKYSSAEEVECTDTLSWDNGAGYGCDAYVSQKWCIRGGFAQYFEWTGGEQFHYPEKQCCACGKTSDEESETAEEDDKDIEGGAEEEEGMQGGEECWLVQHSAHYCATSEAKNLGAMSVGDCQAAVLADSECTSSSKLMYSSGENCWCIFGDECAPAGSASGDVVYALGTCTKEEEVAALDSFDHYYQGCVSGYNLELIPDQTTESCAALCLANDECVGFEFGVAHGGDTDNYAPGDCNMQNGSDPTGCDGALYNVDLYLLHAEGCVDVAGFSNGSGYGCDGYLEQGWCADGAATPGNDWTLGADFRFPEDNCCVCGFAGIDEEPPSCYDNNQCLATAWGAAYNCANSVEWCESYKETMEVCCPTACGFCEEANANTCVDKNECLLEVHGFAEWTCEDDIDHLCNDDQYHDAMNECCPAKCGFCGTPAPKYAHPEGAICIDTPNWKTPSGHTCEDYAEQGWCLHGYAEEGQESMLGVEHMYPETNCCRCGKEPIGGDGVCEDTPKWANQWGYTCGQYKENGWCADGGFPEGMEWAGTGDYLWPESNCCVCGKGAPHSTSVCSWKELEGIVADGQGTDLGGSTVGYSKIACQELCDATEGCQSATFTQTTGSCWMKAKYIEAYSTFTGPGDSITIYKHCKECGGDKSEKLDIQLYVSYQNDEDWLPCRATKSVKHCKTWLEGDGNGTSETAAETQATKEDCVAICIGMAANGATYGNADGLCYCEYGMTGASTSTGYQTCLIESHTMGETYAVDLEIGPFPMDCPTLSRYDRIGSHVRDRMAADGLPAHSFQHSPDFVDLGGCCATESHTEEEDYKTIQTDPVYFDSLVDPCRQACRSDSMCTSFGLNAFKQCQLWFGDACSSDGAPGFIWYIGDTNYSYCEKKVDVDENSLSGSEEAIVYWRSLFPNKPAKLTEANFSKVQFIGNSAKKDGGGLSINGDAGRVHFDGDSFGENSAERGGAIYIVDSDSLESVSGLNDVTISSTNTANEAAQMGCTPSVFNLGSNSVEVKIAVPASPIEFELLDVYGNVVPNARYNVGGEVSCRHNPNLNIKQVGETMFEIHNLEVYGREGDTCKMTLTLVLPLSVTLRHVFQLQLAACEENEEFWSETLQYCVPCFGSTNLDDYEVMAARCKCTMKQTHDICKVEYYGVSSGVKTFLTTVSVIWLIAVVGIVGVFTKNMHTSHGKAFSREMLPLQMSGYLITASGALIAIVSDISPDTCKASSLLFNLGMTVAMHTNLSHATKLIRIYSSKNIKIVTTSKMRMYGAIFMAMMADTGLFIIQWAALEDPSGAAIPFVPADETVTCFPLRPVIVAGLAILKFLPFVYIGLNIRTLKNLPRNFKTLHDAFIASLQVYVVFFFVYVASLSISNPRQSRELTLGLMVFGPIASMAAFLYHNYFRHPLVIDRQKRKSLDITTKLASGGLESSPLTSASIRSIASKNSDASCDDSAISDATGLQELCKDIGQQVESETTHLLNKITKVDAACAKLREQIKAHELGLHKFYFEQKFAAKQKARQ